MPTRLRRPSILRASLALAFAFLGFATTDASAQIGRRLDEHARNFYGPDYRGRGYADSLGLRGHKRLENGGYYGPPQMYSRQFGTIAGYRLDQPFQPLRSSNRAVAFGTSD